MLLNCNLVANWLQSCNNKSDRQTAAKRANNSVYLHEWINTTFVANNVHKRQIKRK